METIKSNYRTINAEYEKELHVIEEKRNEVSLLKDEISRLYNDNVKNKKYYVGTKNPERVAPEFARLQDDLENMYDLNYNTYNEALRNQVVDIETDIFKLDKQIEQREKLNVCRQSWVEHMEYVINLSKVNEGSDLYTMVNKKIADKKKTWVAAGTLYLVWFKAGTCALEWCVETLFN